jgi:hypothetical protein
VNDLDRYLDDFGDALRHARRPRRGLILGGAVALATAVVAALLLIAPAGQQRPGAPVDALAAVRKALDPNGVILHMRVRSDTPPGTHGVQHTWQETWTAQDPQRWRMKQRQRGSHGVDYDSDWSYAHGEFSTYERGRYVVRQGYKDNTPQTRLPTLFSTAGKDPDTDLRSLLTSGKLEDEGEVQSGGRTVRRLVRDDNGLRTVVFDVDPVTFAPIGGTMTFRFPHGGRTMTITLAVEAFERLPITPETEKHLLLDVPPGTPKRVVTATEKHRRERLRQRRNR